MSVVAICVALGVAVSQAQQPERPSYLPSVNAIHTKSPPETSGTEAVADKSRVSKRSPTHPRASTRWSRGESPRSEERRRTRLGRRGGRGGAGRSGQRGRRLGDARAGRAAREGHTEPHGYRREVGMQAYTAVDVLSAHAGPPASSARSSSSTSATTAYTPRRSSTRQCRRSRRAPGRVRERQRPPRLGGAQQRGHLGGRGTLPERRAR